MQPQTVAVSVLDESASEPYISDELRPCDNSPKLNSHKRLENSDLHNLTKQEQPMMWNGPIGALARR